MAAVTANKPHANIRVNVVINLIRTLTLTILSFITFPFVTRALGDQTFGLYTWANTFVYYFLVLAKISIPNFAIRECSKVKDDKEALSTKAQEFFLLQAVMTLLSFGLLCSLCFTVPSLRENNTLIFLLSINFLAGLFSFEWIYIALEKHIYITVRTITFIAFSALLTYIFIRPTTSAASAMDEVYIYALLTILPTILTVVANCILLPRYISLKKTQKYHFLPLLKPMMILFGISLFITAYNQTDSFILGFLDPRKAAVGSYSVGVKGIDIIITLVTSLYTVFLPRATYYYQMEDKRYYRNLLRYSSNITFFIAVPAIATMATMSQPLVNLFSGSGESQYQDAYLVLTVLATMMLTFSLADNIYTEILLPQKKEKIYLVVMLLAVICNVGLSLLLGGIVFASRPVLGVAIATMITDVIVLAAMIFASKEYSLDAILNLNNMKIMIAGILVGVASFFLYPLFHNLYSFNEAWANELMGLFTVVAIDAVLYLLCLGLLREKLVSSFLPRRVKERESEHGES